ncbi:hypothetical protein M2152_002648 [Microbacteriaceae bacterium SG_E_30_P1]|uniref:Uncharacterized protein n=1 Tax=Antiquaquibacter oligotrophicus TaxID=2880260 RepID=A0ABT6KR62_9MICO|nr:hypothetical protein [Antiquaquibacter oligotrophicus]MDH6182466.1 hypothetical protein [Antiquaquibacter oligotrophicus]UDF14563.1 hypothetical protein LH407_06795 [Antiquaquibacter oligotrophicus]
MIARLLKASGVALACAALAALSCSPAAAAELPEHQRLSTIDANTGILYDIDPATGGATALWDTGLEGAQALSLDASGRGFATTNTGPAWQSSLWAVDVTNQSVTEIAPITRAGHPETSGTCHSLQQSGGALYAYCGFYEYPGGTNTYSVIDQATGEFTPLFVFSTGGTEDVIPAIDPADGTLFFAASSHLYLFDLETFDPTAPEGVAQFRVAEFPSFMGSGNFSEGSVLWVPLPDYLTQTTRLATWDRTTGEVQVVGNIAASVPVYSYVVAVWGAAPDMPAPAPAPAAAPELAATGFSPAPLVLVGAGILVLVGAVLAVRRRAA